MTDKTAERRKALGKLVAGSAGLGVVFVLPKAWTRPILDSVTTPAHAQTSVPVASGDGDSTPDPAPTDEIPEREPDIPTTPDPVTPAPSSGTGFVAGSVTASKAENPDDLTIGGATVFFTSMNGLGSFQTTSADDGSYRLSLPADRYAVVCEAQGFRTWMLYPDTVIVFSERAITQNINMASSS